MKDGGHIAAKAPPAATDGAKVRIYLPHDRLKGFVTFYYIVESDGALEDFLYPEWGNVRFNVRGNWHARLNHRYPEAELSSALFGPTDHAARIVTSGGKIIGFGLTPIGWLRFLPIPADHLANRVTPLGDWFGMSGEAVRAALSAQDHDGSIVDLLDRLLLASLDRSKPNPAWAMELSRSLRDRPRDVEQFAAKLGLSGRALARRCKRLFGFAPKRLLRRQRFLETLGKIRVVEPRHYGALVDPEYFDQAHFVHEFREFMGLSPTEFLMTARPLMTHAAEAQLAAGITLSFELPPEPAE
uniref:helix-turn-helix domain-containing protein n=1 Tax=uncultured Sphingomonas sp. TaxID=158754 RepID=UPI0035CBCD76